MLIALLKGFLIVFMLVSLLFLPMQLWFSPTEVLLYCKSTIAITTWLWIIVAPLLLLILGLSRRVQITGRPDEWHPFPTNN